MNIQYSVGQTVRYVNGHPCVYTGEIVKINGNRLVVIGDESGMILWKAGVAAGDCIDVSQVLSDIEVEYVNNLGVRKVVSAGTTDDYSITDESIMNKLSALAVAIIGKDIVCIDEPTAKKVVEVLDPYFLPF